MNWIATAERLPDVDDLVLGFTDSGAMAIFARVDTGEGWSWARQCNAWGIDDPDGLEVDDDYTLTHWMPLPRGPHA